MDSLAIGPHAFEYTGEDMDELIDPNHPENPQYLDISAFENVPLEPGDRLIRVLGQLQHLRLIPDAAVMKNTCASRCANFLGLPRHNCKRSPSI